MSNHFLLGPMIVKDQSATLVPVTLTRTGYALQFSSEFERYCVPIFKKIETWYPQPTLEEYYFKEECCQGVDLYCAEHQVTRSPRGDFISMPVLLASLYDYYSPTTTLMETIDMIAQVLPFRSISGSDNADSDMLHSDLRHLGFAVRHVMSYGDSVIVDLCWLPPFAVLKNDMNQFCGVGVLTFRPKPDGTLGNGTFGQCKEHTVCRHLFEVFRTHAAKTPFACLSAKGGQMCLSAFEWKPRHKLTKETLEQERQRFVTDRMEHGCDPKQIAADLKQAGLYSEFTSVGQIAKRVKTIMSNLKITDPEKKQ